MDGEIPLNFSPLPANPSPPWGYQLLSTRQQAVA
uniref:Uncharacterized protein n=1 Tax=Setaria italica TaxID=4555 RepID=K4A353_SETIT